MKKKLIIQFLKISKLTVDVQKKSHQGRCHGTWCTGHEWKDNPGSCVSLKDSYKENQLIKQFPLLKFYRGQKSRGTGFLLGQSLLEWPGSMHSGHLGVNAGF